MGSIINCNLTAKWWYKNQYVGNLLCFFGLPLELFLFFYLDLLDGIFFSFKLTNLSQKPATVY